jgi:uncharacterized membrane-anchored protein
MDAKTISAKVPAVTLGFWAIKILATTLGETGGDTLSMTFDFGYLVSSAIFLGVLIAFVAGQIATRRFHPLLYWLTIVASTTAGTTMADFATRSLGVGYPGGSILLFVLVMASLMGWYFSEGTVSVQSVNSPRVEAWYWITITFSQTLGTALGDWVAASPDDGPPGIGLGYDGGALFFGAAIAVVAALYFRTRMSRAALFWAAFILTRPLGATIGDWLDKPLAKGGFDVSRPLASAILAAAILVLIVVLPQRAGEHPAAAQS